MVYESTISSAECTMLEVLLTAGTLSVCRIGGVYARCAVDLLTLGTRGDLFGNTIANSAFELLDGLLILDRCLVSCQFEGVKQFLPSWATFLDRSPSGFNNTSKNVCFTDISRCSFQIIFSRRLAFGILGLRILLLLPWCDWDFSFLLWLRPRLVWLNIVSDY